MCHFSIHQPQTSSTPSPLQERAGYCRLHRKPRTNGDSRAMQRGKRETSKIFKDLQYQLLPHLNISDLVGGIYSATDGSVDPTGLTTAYARGARPDKIQSGNILKISTFFLHQAQCWEGLKCWKVVQSPECWSRMAR